MIDKIIADGGNGLDVLIYCLKHEPFIQGIILFALIISLFSCTMIKKMRKRTGVTETIIYKL